MAEIKFTLNGRPASVNVNPRMPLLWALRDALGLTGTKFGCGMQLCGACTVHLEGQPVRSCGTPVSSVAGKKVTTIEGLSADGRHPVQQAWMEEDVPQCGYCQSGQIMTAAGLLAKKANPTDADIDEAMRGNICRCGTYQAIRRAVHRAAQIRRAGNGGRVAAAAPAAAAEGGVA
jgi:aerobic-type carbon monoxide dehydrogenase small subunit (CoxS/CutS family)